MNQPNKLYKKTILWNGDSICAGFAATGNWASRIAEKNNMISKNYAVHGGTIADHLPLTKNGSVRHSVCRTLDQMYAEFPDADYIVIEGGTNDADLLGNAVSGSENTLLGDFSPADFSGNYDDSTFCGALESVFYRSSRYWMGKKIAYIAAQKMGLGNDSYYNRRFYFDKAIEICKKWGVPYLDLWNGCPLNPMLPWMYDSTKTQAENIEANVGFYCDSQHMTARGYDVTADTIDSFLKTL